MARRITVDTLSRFPQRPLPPHKKRTQRKALFVFRTLMMLVVVLAIVWTARFISYRSARKEYEQIRAAFETPVPSQPPATPLPAQTEPAATVVPIYSEQVAALYRANPDTVGWLEVLDTDIRYPIVQSTDNEYYRTHTFGRNANDSGAIFLDCWNMPNFTDFNTVIYGHNMQDGSMFSGLRKYRHQYFFDEHPYIEVTRQNSKLRYQVFAAYISQGEEDADFRGQSCVTELERSSFIKAARKRSTELDSTLTVSRHDRLLTLVTCTGGDHPWFWVVHAVLTDEIGAQQPLIY